MINQIIETLELHTNENQIKQALRHGCDISIIGVSISDMKKISKQYKIKKDQHLVKELLQSDTYELLYLGCINLDDKMMDLELFKNIYDKTSYSALTESQIALIAAQSPHKDVILDFLSKHHDDKAQSCYYSLLSGLLSMDPNYNDDLISKHVDLISLQIIDSEIRTKFQMNNFLAIAAVQKPHLEKKIISVYEQYIDTITFKYNQTNCKLTDLHKFIENTKKRGKTQMTRKKCRC